MHHFPASFPCFKSPKRDSETHGRPWLFPWLIGEIAGPNGCPFGMTLFACWKSWDIRISPSQGKLSRFHTSTRKNNTKKNTRTQKNNTTLLSSPMISYLFLVKGLTEKKKTPKPAWTLLLSSLRAPSKGGCGSSTRSCSQLVGLYLWVWSGQITIIPKRELRGILGAFPY